MLDKLNLSFYYSVLEEEVIGDGMEK